MMKIDDYLKYSTLHRAYNNNGIAPAFNMARNVKATMADAGDESFADFAEFYGKLGTHVRDITPTKFVLGVGTINLYAPNGEMMSIGQGIFDFAQDITLTPGEIPTDVTCSAMSFTFCSSGIAFEGGPAGYAYVEFEWPLYDGTDDQAGRQAEFAFHQGFYNTSLPGENNPPAPPLPGFTPAWNGNKVTVLLNAFEPHLIQQIFTLGGTELKPLDYIIYGAGNRRLYNGEKVPTNSIIPGLNSLYGGMGIGNEWFSSIVIPYTPIYVPSNASSVTFNMSWNLNGIISQYCGEDGIADTADDIFVLKDGWWNGLQISANVQ